jgi:hypothetical protein
MRIMIIFCMAVSFVFCNFTFAADPPLQQTIDLEGRIVCSAPTRSGAEPAAAGTCQR